MGGCGVRLGLATRLSGRATARLAAEDCSERVRVGGDPGVVAVARLTRLGNRSLAVLSGGDFYAEPGVFV